MARYCADWNPDEVPSAGSELLVLGGRQRLEHGPLLEELLLDQLHARQALERVLERVDAHVAHHGRKLVDHELHPELGDLVLDDEEHLVVACRGAVTGRQRRLAREQAVELQVAPRR